MVDEVYNVKFTFWISESELQILISKSCLDNFLKVASESVKNLSFVKNRTCSRTRFISDRKEHDAKKLLKIKRNE